MSSHGNGGAFGGKQSGELGAVARRLADRHGRAVRVLSTREDVVRLGPKRPPLAAGVRQDGSGVVHVARTEGIADVIKSVVPRFEVVELAVAGPPTSAALRGAGWVELSVLLASLSDVPPFAVTSPSGARAIAEIDADGSIRRRGVVRRSTRHQRIAQLLRGCRPHGAGPGHFRGSVRRRRGDPT